MRPDGGFFDHRAKDWESSCYPPAVRARLLSLLPEFGVNPGDRVLDIGTGPGVLIPYLRKRVGPGGWIFALDLSLPMVREAQVKRSSSRDLVLQADVHRLPFAPDRFDRVICFAAFPHFHSPETALAEMARVAVAGGTVIVAHLMSREGLARHHSEAHSAVADHVLPDAAGMRDLFRSAGLSDPRITDIPGRYLARASRDSFR